MSTSIVPVKVVFAWGSEHWWKDLTVLVAVSGGADSVALLRAMMQRRADGGTLVVAHFNHGLRGPESDGDQAFVEDLAARQRLRVVVGQHQAERETASDSASEESLRSARYAFLAHAAGAVGARYIATAHTADDQVETVLLNLLRGTGLAGLSGIPRFRPLSEATTLIRPMLSVTRSEVLEYLSEIRQPFREDASNRSLDYTRNRIRHELLPLLARDYNPHVRDALRRLSQLAGEAEEENSVRARELLARIAQPIPGGIQLLMGPLLACSEFMARSTLLATWRGQGWPLQDMSLEKWKQLLSLARASEDDTPPPQIFPGGIRGERDGDTLRLTRLPT